MRMSGKRVHAGKRGGGLCLEAEDEDEQHDDEDPDDPCRGYGKRVSKQKVRHAGGKEGSSR
jgi:hypothetical protein